MGIAPGWYPDPDDPTARRYWDGASWSAPLPADEGYKHGGDPDAETPEAARERRAAMMRSDDPEVRRAAIRESVAAQQAKDPPTTSRGAPTGERAIVCPHCGVQGKVTKRQVKQKKGISGAKATGALFTAGLSMIGTGLSRKEWLTEMHCGQCGTTWHV